MDLTAIYELRSRLCAAAIAGTELLAEDYRLKRALSAMKPLERVSPVFVKIGILVNTLLAPNCPDRVGFLMEAISLTDALLCTQVPMSVSGEMEEIVATESNMKTLNIPYSILHTLLDALQNSGQGRYSYVLEMHEKNPQLFADYRVKLAMVQALGASYGELADQVAEWLKQDGESIVPLLKDGFDKKGKKDMVRRIKVIETIAKEKENAFYLAQIPDSEKQVREALILALSHAQENVTALIDLTRTEKGNCKKMAYWALACMENEEAEAFWRAYAKKKPAEAIPYLRLSKSVWASELICMELQKLLQEWMPKALAQEIEVKTSVKEELTAQLSQYQDALLGKNGEVVSNCFRQIVKTEKMLQLQLESGKYLHTAYLIAPSNDLGALALELYETYGVEYFSAAFCSMLMEQDWDVCCAWLEKQIWQKNLLYKKIKEQYVEPLIETLKYVVWDANTQSYVLSFVNYHPTDGQVWQYKTTLKHSMQGYFTDLLMQLGRWEADEILSTWIPAVESAYNQKLLEYYYQRAMICKDNRSYLRLLKRCGAQECKGLAVQYFTRKASVSSWEIPYYFSEMPGSIEAKREEARRLYEAILQGRIRGVRLQQANGEDVIDAWVRY